MEWKREREIDQFRKTQITEEEEKKRKKKTKKNIWLSFTFSWIICLQNYAQCVWLKAIEIIIDVERAPPNQTENRKKTTYHNTCIHKNGITDEKWSKRCINTILFVNSSHTWITLVNIRETTEDFTRQCTIYYYYLLRKSQSAIDNDDEPIDKFWNKKLT